MQNLTAMERSTFVPSVADSLVPHLYEFSESECQCDLISNYAEGFQTKCCRLISRICSQELYQKILKQASKFQLYDHDYTDIDDTGDSGMGIRKHHNTSQQVAITPENIVMRNGNFFGVLYQRTLLSVYDPYARYFSESGGGTHSYWRKSFSLIAKDEDFVTVSGKKITRKDL